MSARKESQIFKMAKDFVTTDKHSKWDTYAWDKRYHIVRIKAQDLVDFVNKCKNL